MSNESKISTRMPPVNVGFKNSSNNVGQTKGVATESLFKAGNQDNKKVLGNVIDEFKVTKSDRDLIRDIRSTLNKIGTGGQVPLLSNGLVNVNQTTSSREMVTAFFGAPFFVTISKTDMDAAAQKVVGKFVRTVQEFMQDHNEDKIVGSFHDANAILPTNGNGKLNLSAMTPSMMVTAIVGHYNLMNNGG